MVATVAPDEVLGFWFDELTPAQHFAKDPKLDAAIAGRFKATHAAATRGELYPWRDGASGRLAEIIVLDQFSRNIDRDTAAAFAHDPVALTLAQEMVHRGLDRELPDAHRGFACMPYMHSESAVIHEVALALFSQPGLENQLKYEQAHKAIIDRFGRYPHRNAALGRVSTAEEAAFLEQPGSSF